MNAETKSSDNVTSDNATFNVVVTRQFDAPPSEVWKAWSDAEMVMRWWGPTGFTSPTCKMDFRVGGVALVCMRSPEGIDMFNTWTYRKIVPTERIELIVNFADKDGNIFDPATIGMPPGIPMSVPHVITFAAVAGGKTEMTVSEYGYSSEQVVEMSTMGLQQSLDKLEAFFAVA